MWKTEGLEVTHPQRGPFPVRAIDAGCPQIPRSLALGLIEEMENKMKGIGVTKDDFQRMDSTAGGDTPSPEEPSRVSEEEAFRITW